MTWTAHDIPDLTDRRAVVTGANSGLGFHTTLELARRGAQVTMAVRDTVKGGEAAARITAELAGGTGSVAVAALDLADLASVRAFAAEHVGERLDLLVNNAGVMAIPRRITVDGFEMQLATNHLGHMALTLGLLPALVRTGEQSRTTRVVTVSSNAHKMGRIQLDDLMGESGYKPWGAYGQSKLANLLFTLELQRRLTLDDLPVAAYAAHPGFASTNLQAAGPEMSGSAFRARLADLTNKLIAQPAEMGALPTLFAATEPGLAPGSYAGPDGFLEQRGHPKVVTTTSAGRDVEMAGRLWAASEELIGLRYADVLPA